MAQEKHKEQIKFERPVVKQNVKKTKRNRHKTECSIKRFKEGCGICGSLNIAQHGVRYCTKCGIEVYYFIERSNCSWNLSNEVPKLKCKCLEHRKYKLRGRIKVFTSKPEKAIYVNACLDCGSIQSNYCPVCGSSVRECWKSINGKLLCQRCNFRGEIS